MMAVQANPEKKGRIKRPLNRRIQARLMALANIPMRVVLSLPFETPLSGRLMLLSYTGRKSGKAYRQPVSYVQQGDTLLTPGGGNWKWNLQDGQPVKIHLRGRDVMAKPELVEEADEVERLLKVMAEKNPATSAFAGVRKGPDGRLDRAQLETAIQYGFRVVRWRLGEDGKYEPT